MQDLRLQRAAIKKAMAPALIAEPLKSKIQAWLDVKAKAGDGAALPDPTTFEVIIELNLDHPGSRSEARTAVTQAIRKILGASADAALKRNQLDATHPYVFARLTQDQILAVIESDGMSAINLDMQTKDSTDDDAGGSADMKKAVPHRHLRAIFRIWQAQQVTP
jgi:hypothetical protein